MELPDTPAGRRGRWVIDHTGESAATADEIPDQFEPWFLERVPLEKVIGFLAQSGYLRDAPIIGVHARSDRAIVVRFSVEEERVAMNVQVDNLPPHRITGLTLTTGPTRLEVLDETPAATGPLEEIVRGKIEPFAQSLPAGGIVIGAKRKDESFVAAFEDAPRAAMYDIGSITKPFSGVLLAEMARRGEVGLDDEVSTHLPSGVSAPGGVTLLGLATHSAGLPSIPPNFEPADMANPWANFTEDVMYAALADTQLEFEPGTRTSYSNFGFSLLGNILQLAGGKPYSELIATRVCRPLGLETTRVVIGAPPEELAQGYTRTGAPTPHWNDPTPGAGGICTTIDDLLAFAVANLDPGHTTLAEALVDAQQPRIEDGERGRVGLGWHMLVARDATRVIWHNGGAGGFRSFVAFHRETGTAVAALCNNGGSDPDAAVLSVLAALISE